MTLLLLLMVAFLSTQAAASDQVMVSAAISLRNVLDEAWEPFVKEHGEIVLNAAGSGTLLRQILQGAPVDLFISASTAEMDELEQNGLLVPGSRCTLASNRLVVIVPLDQPELDQFEDLAVQGQGKIAIGNPKTVPAGRYAQAALTSLKLWDAVKDRLVYAENVRQAVEYVARGDVDAGLVYLTDATVFRERLLVGPTAPEGSHEPILYEAALLKDGPKLEQAAELLRFLNMESSREVFRRHGFQDPP
jgi:molybdate transport system substrate-binding protein